MEEAKALGVCACKIARIHTLACSCKQPVLFSHSQTAKISTNKAQSYINQFD